MATKILTVIFLAVAFTGLFGAALLGTAMLISVHPAVYGLLLLFALFGAWFVVEQVEL
jgi:hypothetical protein